MDFPAFSTPALLEALSAHERWLATTNALAEEPPEGAQLSLQLVTLSNLRIADRDFSASELLACRFTHSTFHQCQFSYAMLVDCEFEECTFHQCSFVKANLHSADCTGVDFSASDFTRADLTDAILYRADLSDCLLYWAWLHRTDLRYARLANVELKGARLLEAKVYNTERYQFGSLEEVLIQDIYTSPDGNGEPQSGVEALAFLQA